MKALLATLLTSLSAPLISAAILTPAANALPFKPDCESMARYTAVLTAKENLRESYSFIGFKGPLRREEGYSDIYCEGFISETSPKGTLVCDGYISYTEKDGMLSWRAGSFRAMINKIEALRQERMIANMTPEGRNAVRPLAEMFDRLRGLAERPTSCRWK